MEKSRIAESVSLDEFNGDNSENAVTTGGTDDGNSQTSEQTGTGETASPGTGEETEAGRDFTGEGPKRRGRKPGQKNKEKTDTTSIKSLSSLLFVVHVSLANLVKSPSLMLNQEECDKLAEATANVSKHYNLSLTEKQRDILAFAFCAGSIYAPRIVQARKEIKEWHEKKDAFK